MDTPEGELPHSDPWMDTPYRYIKHLLNWKSIRRWHFIQFGKGGTWWPSSMRFSLTLKYIYIIFPFLIMYQRKKRLCIFCPFFICGGNIEVTFCSLLMDPRRQTSNPVMDVAFSFFLLAPSVMMMKMGHICLNICQQDGSSVRGTLLFNLIWWWFAWR